MAGASWEFSLGALLTTDVGRECTDEADEEASAALRPGHRPRWMKEGRGEEQGSHEKQPSSFWLRGP